MSDLIRREAAIEAIGKAVTKECALWSIKAMPTMDAVEVVRCKDCKKFSYTNYISRPYGWCEAHEGTERDDGFCYRGEKNE